MADPLRAISPLSKPLKTSRLSPVKMVRFNGPGLCASAVSGRVAANVGQRRRRAPSRVCRTLGAWNW